MKVDDSSFLHDKENFSLWITITERSLYDMVSLRQFRIVFNNEDATYEPGEVVGGKIIVETTKDKYTKGELLWLWNATEF